MKNSILPIVLAAVVSSQFTLIAKASEASLMRQGMRSCGGDVSRFCSGILPGDGRIAKCLLNHRAKLSASCSAFMEKTKSAQTLMFACQADAQRHCDSVKPGNGRIVSCLNEKRNEISKTCADALSEAEIALQP